MFLLGFGWFGVSFQGCARLVDTCTYALNLCAEKRRGQAWACVNAVHLR